MGINNNKHCAGLAFSRDDHTVFAWFDCRLNHSAHNSVGEQLCKQEPRFHVSIHPK